MLEEGKNKLAFQNHHKQLSVPFIIYADFEALITKVEGQELADMKSNTRKTQHNEACSYCYVVVRCDGQTEPPVEYRGPNAAEHFLKALQEEERKIKTVLANPKAERTGGHITAPPPVMCVKNHLRVTTVTSSENTEMPLITRAT